MCGCLGKTTNTTPSYKGNKNRRVSTVKESVCGHLYTELKDLNTLVLKMWKDNKKPLLLQANRQLSYWRKHLDKKCPNDVEYNILKNYIENEYSNYIT